MEKVLQLQCECGFEARAQEKDGLVGEVQRHATEGHGMTLSYDEALLLVSRAGLAEEAPPAISQERATPTDEEER